MINFKSAVRRIFPQSAIEQALYLATALPKTSERSRTHEILQKASPRPAYLEYEDLVRLQEQYPQRPAYGYSPDLLESRGIERARQILRLPTASAASTFLELACWDGMVSAAISKRGKKTVAIDAQSDGFDDRATEAGTILVGMDAASLTFEDNSFDFVFSYDAFEHFANPEAVLQQAIRVAKPNGHIYLEFGPLYYSPWGEHAYDAVKVPYCQFLFTRDAMERLTKTHGLTEIDWNHVNHLALRDYRDLWKKYSNDLKPIQYFERLNLSHLDLIRAYPSCFISKSSDFENFTVSNVSALFQVTKPNA